MSRTGLALAIGLVIATPAVIGAPALVATPASAQAKVPITRDLRENDENRADLGLPPAGRGAEMRGTGTVTPANPTGVAGFNGPPGIFGNSVNSYAPLPPGSPGNEELF